MIRLQPLAIGILLEMLVFKYVTIGGITVQIVLCSQSCKLLWDHTIVTDRRLPHNQPDITLVLLNEKKAFLVDVAIPGDSRLYSKVLEKQTKYTDLKIEVQKLWNVSCQIVPIVVGILGSIPQSLTECLATISLQAVLVRTIQKSVLLSSVHLIRRYLSVDS